MSPEWRDCSWFAACRAESLLSDAPTFEHGPLARSFAKKRSAAAGAKAQKLVCRRKLTKLLARGSAQRV